MKIKLRYLKSNPFKKQINGGKLDEEKIKMLMESIHKDGFWDNIICRKRGDGFEIAYGHHRLAAVRRVFGTTHEVDIPCIRLSDEAMLRIMGNENCMQNEEYTIYQVDQVVATKRYLETSASNGGTQTKPHTRTDQGIGARQISKFLGERLWPKTKVAEFLRIHRDLHPELLSKLRNNPRLTDKDDEGMSVQHAQFIARLPKSQQKGVAKTVNDFGLSKRKTETLVKDIKEGKLPTRRTGTAKAIKEYKEKIEQSHAFKEIRDRCVVLIREVKKFPLESFPHGEAKDLRELYGEVMELLKNERRTI